MEKTTHFLGCKTRCVLNVCLNTSQLSEKNWCCNLKYDSELGKHAVASVKNDYVVRHALTFHLVHVCLHDDMHFSLDIATLNVCTCNCGPRWVGAVTSLNV